jgi:hypothetical protein
MCWRLVEWRQDGSLTCWRSLQGWSWCWNPSEQRQDRHADQSWNSSTKCQILVFWNPGIWGEAEFKEFFLPHYFLCQHCLWYFYCLASLDVSSPDWHSLALSSILNNSTNIKSKLFNFIVNQFTISLKKHGIVRPKNWFGKPNPGISASMKCFWISTQSRKSLWM